MEKASTGGPRNLRTFYLQIRFFAMNKNIPKLSIRGISVVIPSLILFLFFLSFLTIQCSLVIRGILVERIYRELRGPPVCSRTKNFTFVLLLALVTRTILTPNITIKRFYNNLIIFCHKFLWPTKVSSRKCNTRCI